MRRWLFFVTGYLVFLSAHSQDSLLSHLQFPESEFLVDTATGAMGIRHDLRLNPYQIQVIKPAVFNIAPPVNFLNTFIGKAAGMNTLRAQGGLESGTRIIFRGHRSLNQNNQPLLLLDGIPVSEGLEMISPEDVASVSLLSGASASALYGSRAQNGVILIEMKKAHRKREISYSTSYQADYANVLIDFQQKYGQGYDKTYHPRGVNAWGAPLEGQEVAHWSPDPTLANETYLYESQYRFSDFIRPGHQWSSHLSISENLGPISSYFSYGYLDAGGIIPNNDLTRHHTMLRLNGRAGEKFSFDTKVNFIWEDHENYLPPGQSYSNPYRHAYRVPPNLSNQAIANFEYLDAEGQFRQNFWNPGSNGWANPYWAVYRNTNELRKESFYGLVKATYQLKPNLTVQWRSGVDLHHRNEEERLANDTYIIADHGKFSIDKWRTIETNHDFLITYSPNPRPELDLQIILGAANRSEQNGYLNGKTDLGLITPNHFSLSNTQDASTSFTSDRRKVNALFNQNRIIWRDLVQLEFGCRVDWISSLDASRYAQHYPFVASSIMVSDLLDLPGWLNVVKLRAAYSKTGNDFAPYQLLREFIPPNETNPFAQVSDQIHDTGLRPERTHSQEIGLDLALLQERVQFWLTYYRTTTLDHLLRVPLPIGAGANQLLTNGGKVSNQGFEISLFLRLLQNKEMLWDMMLHFTRNKNSVQSLHENLQSVENSANFLRRNIHEVGEPWGQIYARGLERNGVGNVLVGSDGLPLITNGLETFVSNLSPKWLAGFQQNFKYRNLQLTFSIDLRKGGTIISATDMMITGGGFNEKSLEGRDGGLIFGTNFFAHEKAIDGSGNFNTKAITGIEFWNTVTGCCAPVAEVWVKDATNARLRDISLGYSFDLKKSDVAKEVNISLVGRNLFYLFHLFDSDAWIGIWLC